MYLGGVAASFAAADFLDRSVILRVFYCPVALLLRTITEGFQEKVFKEKPGENGCGGGERW